jgi:hypothetical protein
VFSLDFRREKIPRGKKKFCGFLIKSANKKKKIFLSGKLNSKYANKKLKNKLYLNM